MTTATTGRVRRSVRFARLDAQTESSFRNTSLRRERITGAEKLDRISFQNTQDWVSGVGMSPSGRFQVIEESRKKPALFQKNGLRADFAKALLWLLGMILCVTLLVRAATVGTAMLQAQKLEARITAAQSRERELKTQLAKTGGDISVCTRAVELDLISSTGAPTIQLTAPERATMNLIQPQESQATQEPDVRAALGTGSLYQGD